VAALLVAAGFGLWILVRRRPGARLVAPWDGGFAAPPPWLPFGDPATQSNAAALTAPMLDVLGGARWWDDRAGPYLARAAAWYGRSAAGSRPRWALAILLAAALAGLAGVAWLEGA